MSEHVSRYHVVVTSYALATETLLVRLASGIYSYGHVPRDLANRFAAARDKDAFFLQHIHEQYSTTYISSSDPQYRASAGTLDSASGENASQR